MFETILTVILVIICVLLILLILLQSNRSAGMGLFGGGSQSAFGASSGDVLTKATSFLVAGFMLITLVLAFVKGDTTNKSGVTKELQLEQQKLNATEEQNDASGAATSDTTSVKPAKKTQSAKKK